MNCALKDHLDNVRVTHSDLKLKAGADFELDLLGVSNYYPFGMQQPGRNWVSTNGGEYWNRFGFNGKEKDDELKGKGNSCDYGARHYDPRIVRWYSLDPMMDKRPSWSGYNFCKDNPINRYDPDGRFDMDWHKKNMAILLKDIKMNSMMKLVMSELAGNVDISNYFDSKQHFDNMKSFKQINDNWNMLNKMTGSIHSIKKPDDQNIFAYVAHARTDFYAHSNYIELYCNYYSSQEENKGKTLNINEIPTWNQMMNDEKYKGFKESLMNNPSDLKTGTYNGLSSDVQERILGWFGKIIGVDTHYLINKDNGDSKEGKNFNPVTNSSNFKAADNVAKRDLRELIYNNLEFLNGDSKGAKK